MVLPTHLGERAHESDGLHGFPQAHFICEDAIDALIEEGQQPGQSLQLVGLQVALEEGGWFSDVYGGVDRGRRCGRICIRGGRSSFEVRALKQKKEVKGQEGLQILVKPEMVG